MYYEIPLYWTGGQFNVHGDLGSLGKGFASQSDLIHEIGNGGQVEQINESELPAPLNNSIYRNLEIYRVGGKDNFVGIAEL